MFTFILVYVVMCIIAYNVAKGKGFSNSQARLWIFWTLLFGIFAILVLLSKPKISEQTGNTSPVAQSNSNPFSRASMSPADEIAKYKMLLDAGAITKAEYELKKNELLNTKAIHSTNKIGTSATAAKHNSHSISSK